MTQSIRLVYRAPAGGSRVGPSRLVDMKYALDSFDVAYVLLDGEGSHVSPGARRGALSGALEAVLDQAERLGRDVLAAGEAGCPVTATEPRLAANVPAVAPGFDLTAYQLLKEDGRMAVIVLLQPRYLGAATTSRLDECRLTRREQQVARLIARGCATKEIASALSISPHTARHHTERVFQKLGVQSRAAAAAAVASLQAAG